MRLEEVLWSSSLELHRRSVVVFWLYRYVLRVFYRAWVWSSRIVIVVINLFDLLDLLDLVARWPDLELLRRSIVSLWLIGNVIWVLYPAWNFLYLFDWFVWVESHLKLLRRAVVVFWHEWHIVRVFNPSAYSLLLVVVVHVFIIILPTFLKKMYLGLHAGSLSGLVNRDIVLGEFVQPQSNPSC